jgi:hypothetical protein
VVAWVSRFALNAEIKNPLRNNVAQWISFA